MKALTLVQAVNDALLVEMRLNPNIIVYGEDVGVEGGVFRATTGLQKEFGDKRCFDSPLAESALAGTAVGMSVLGLKPVIEMQFSGFAWPAFNQIISHVARFRNRTRGAMTTDMVIRMPYGGGIRALEHHSESMEAIWAHIPGIKVVIPSNPYDAKGLLIAAMRHADPVIFMEPKRLYRSIKQEVPDDAYTIEIGKAKIVTAGSDLTLLSYGAQMKEATEATFQLKTKGISVELIDLRTISPIDKKTIIASVKKTGRFLVVHEGPQSYGIGGELVSTVTENCFTDLFAPPARMSSPDITPPLPRGERLYLISTDMIVNKIMELINYRP